MKPIEIFLDDDSAAETNGASAMAAAPVAAPAAVKRRTSRREGWGRGGVVGIAAVRGIAQRDTRRATIPNRSGSGEQRTGGVTTPTGHTRASHSRPAAAG